MIPDQKGGSEVRNGEEVHVAFTLDSTDRGKLKKKKTFLHPFNDSIVCSLPLKWRFSQRSSRALWTAEASSVALIVREGPLPETVSLAGRRLQADGHPSPEDRSQHSPRGAEKPSGFARRLRPLTPSSRCPHAAVM